MAKLNVAQSHSLPLETARTKVQELFEVYKSRFGISSKWEGNNLKLSGSGFDGEARLTDGHVEVDVKLGLAVSMFKNQVESTLKHELEKRLSA